ncbi:uracil-DNA glycosylase family protein [Candidatus Latescibacterota bacterium]
MNPGDLKKIASFIAQRQEMGESEWYLNPGLINPDKLITKLTPDHDRKNTASEIITGEISAVKPTIEKEPCSLSNFSDDFITGQKTFEELHDAVCGCMRCPLGQIRKNFVFGSGDPQADIMFIGEAPGADEDEQGLPFVGRAGKFLTKMIESIKLSRDEVYISNVLKCRPPGNRDPRPLEIEKCEPIFIKQIEFIKPKIIFALGRISGQTLLKVKSPLRALRGKIHDYHGVKLIVSYHPAALLRNSNWKPAAWEDLKFLRREYDGLEL